MGPQLYRCGNFLFAAAYCIQDIGFNGAATLSLRKLYPSHCKAAIRIGLQWGRNFIVAETAQAPPPLARPGPGFNGAATLSLRKRSPVASGGATASQCFNGAATLSLRKRWSGSPCICRGLRGFNGAATLSLRKLFRDGYLFILDKELQWGRNFIVAETGRILFGRVCGKCFASMGPQLYRCGNCSRKISCTVESASLQWGRNFIVAETRLLSPRNCLIPSLQWGRNFIVAETNDIAAPNSCSISSFNGAATLSLRKPRPRRRRSALSSSFNGAATLSLRKRVGLVYLLDQISLASMGPQLYRCGNLSRARPAVGHGSRFNGAATLSLRKQLDPYRFLGGYGARFNGAATLSLRKRYWIVWWRCTGGLASMGPQLYRCGNKTLPT